MRLADLCGAEVVTAAGERLGVIHEVYVTDGEVAALGVGAANLLERLLGRRHGHRVAWTKVRRVHKRTIIVEE